MAEEIEHDGNQGAQVRAAVGRYPAAVLATAVAGASSMAGVLKALDLPTNGGSHAHISALIRQAGISTAHFVDGGTASRGRKGVRHRRRPPAERLVLGAEGTRPPNSVRLREALIASGVPYVCSICAIGPEWHGERLTLQVDHRNGRRHDNRIENLRFVCPNCHSQTETFGTRNRRWADHEPAGPTVRRAPRATHAIGLAELALGGYTTAGESVECTWGGAEAIAVIGAHGEIIVDGTACTTPSSALAVARRAPGGNGWRWWHVHRDGRLVPLAELRAAAEGVAN
jgi:hypothetical protein